MSINKLFKFGIWGIFALAMFSLPSAVRLGAQEPAIVTVGHVRGDINAPVTIEEWFDYQCSFCNKFETTLSSALTDYAGKVNVRVMHFPLSFHNMAEKAAEAAECAAKQGEPYFWKMHDWLMSKATVFTLEDIKDYALQIDLLPNDNFSATTFNNCLDSGDTAGIVSNYITQGTNKGINGTPTSFVILNKTGQSTKVEGAVTYDDLKRQIDKALSSSTLRVTLPTKSDVWKLGETKTIKWQSSNISSSSMVSISVAPPVLPCLNNDSTRRCLPAIIAPYQIATLVPNSGSYDWNIPADLLSKYQGQQIITIAQPDSGITASSEVFTIVGSATINNPPAITGVGGLTNLKVNEVGTWSIKVYDSDSTNLYYSVDWGDSLPQAAKSQPSINNTYSQETTFTHSYAIAGGYKIIFTVSDDKGASALSTITVKVGDEVILSDKNKMIAAKDGYYAFKLNWYHGAADLDFFDANHAIGLAEPLDVGATNLKTTAPINTARSYIIFDPENQIIEWLMVDVSATNGTDVKLTKPLVGKYHSSNQGKTQIVPVMGSYWGHLPDSVGLYDLGYFKAGDEIKVGHVTQWHEQVWGPFISTNPEYYFFKASGTSTCFTAEVDDGGHMFTLDASFDVYYTPTQVVTPFPIMYPSFKSENYNRTEPGSSCTITIPIVDIHDIEKDATDVQEGKTKDNAHVSDQNAQELLSKAEEIMKKIKALESELANLRSSIKDFIAYGTPTTQRLGAGERAGVVASFQEAFGKSPEQDADWQDVIKIANGRWPTQRNDQSETDAEKTFQKIYLRAPNRDNNPKDDAAVTIMAYGLRPNNRNLNSEAAALKSYKGIYGHYPASAADWDAVRAISYSGATR